MDELAVMEPAEPMLATMHRGEKRESGYCRMKRRALKAEGALAEARKASASENEVTALESLAHRLLGHLEAAVSSDITPQQRRGFLNLVADVRRNLDGQ
jgi:hypothetical protein